MYENVLSCRSVDAFDGKIMAAAPPQQVAPLVAADPAVLLDFNVPLDVTLLETTVALMYGAGTNEQVCCLVDSPCAVTGL